MPDKEQSPSVTEACSKCDRPSLGRDNLGRPLDCAEHVRRLDNGDVAHGCEVCDGEDTCTCAPATPDLGKDEALVQRLRRLDARMIDAPVVTHEAAARIEALHAEREKLREDRPAMIERMVKAWPDADAHHGIKETCEALLDAALSGIAQGQS